MVAKLTKGSCLSVSSINKTPLASPLFYNSPMGEVGIISFPTLYKKTTSNDVTGCLFSTIIMPDFARCCKCVVHMCCICVIGTLIASMNK